MDRCIPSDVQGNISTLIYCVGFFGSIYKNSVLVKVQVMLL